MAQFVKVRGLARRGFRVNNQQVTSGKTIVVDLDDGVARRDLGHHISIGQLAVVGSVDVAVARTGAVVSAGTTTTVSVSAGELKIANQDGGPATTVTVAAVNNTAIAANASGVDRLDIVQVHRTTGAATVKTGNAATLAVVPPDALNITIATVQVQSPLVASTNYIYTDVAPRL